MISFYNINDSFTLKFCKSLIIEIETDYLFLNSFLHQYPLTEYSWRETQLHLFAQQEVKLKSDEPNMMAITYRNGKC